MINPLLVYLLLILELEVTMVVATRDLIIQKKDI
jgi:hypothetical protein